MTLMTSSGYLNLQFDDKKRINRYQFSYSPLRGLALRGTRRRTVRRREPASGPLLARAGTPGQGMQAFGQLGGRGRGEAGSPLEGGRARVRHEVL